jgi:hypothetical protein
MSFVFAFKDLLLYMGIIFMAIGLGQMVYFSMKLTQLCGFSGALKESRPFRILVVVAACVFNIAILYGALAYFIVKLVKDRKKPRPRWKVPDSSEP